MRPPEFGEVVVVADDGLHAVHDDGTAVDEYPFAGIQAFESRDLAAVFLHGAGGGKTESAGLAVAGAGSDDDALKGARLVGGVVDADVLSLDVFQGVDDKGNKFFSSHSFFFNRCCGGQLKPPSAQAARPRAVGGLHVGLLLQKACGF